LNDLFLRACRREPVERTPIWIMRQAGRYMSEYRAVRKRHDFLTVCRTPELAAEVTLQPIDKLGVDAAILFSDILILGEALGFEMEFSPGPVLAAPVRSADDVAKMRTDEPQARLGFVYESIRILRRELTGRVPLIGFAAAPFTLAVYLVEGGGSKNFGHIKGLLFGDPATAHALMERLADATARHLLAQIEAGAQAVQLFDTWAGLLGPDEYREFDLRYTRQVLDRLKEAGVPRIYFALNSNHLYDEVRESGADVLGVDWRTPLDRAGERLGPDYALQGNLDPCVLLGSAETVKQHARRVLERAAGLPGHIFNLGHGILPNTPVENALTLVRTVHGEI
jgi:uroporphyrinogen decarboxylase